MHRLGSSIGSGRIFPGLRPSPGCPHLSILSGSLLIFQDAASILCACFSGRDGQGYQYAIGQPGGELRPLVKELNQALQGRGGGKPDFVQGSVAAGRSEIEHFFQTHTL